MQCAEFETQLHRSLDCRNDPEADSQLLAHAQSCESCLQMLHAQRVLFEGLHHPIPQPESAYFGHEILDEVVAHQQRRHKRRRLALALAVAATVLIVVLPFARGPRPGPGKSGRTPGGLAIAAVPASSPDPTMTPEEAAEFRSLVRQLLHASARPLQSFESVDHVATKSIRPLAVTFNFAFDRLWRSLPGQGGTDPQEPQAHSTSDVDWVS